MNEKRKVGRPRSVEPVAEAPPEGIELQIEGFMFTILAAMEKKLIEAINNFQPPVAAAPVTQGAVPQQTVEQIEIDKKNSERLAQFKADKKAMEDKAIAEQKRRDG